MENEVTEKLVLFLQNLRCEDAGRETLVHLAGSKREKEGLGNLRTGYEKLKERMPASDKDYLEKYMEQVERWLLRNSRKRICRGCMTLSRFCKGQA